MKKLFFSALVAAVAVGGALSTNAQFPLYFPGTEDEVPCSHVATASCLENTGKTEATDTPFASVPLIDIRHYHFDL